MARQQISPEVTARGSKKCCISIAVDGTDGDMLRDGSAEGWMLGAGGRKMKALTSNVVT